jgi:serine/threonine protein kinase
MAPPVTPVPRGHGAPGPGSPSWAGVISSSGAHDEALLEVGRRQRLVHPERLELAAAAARGGTLGQSLRSLLTADELRGLQEAARRTRFGCPRGCVQVRFDELQSLQSLACPRCAAGLTGVEEAPLQRARRFDTAQGTGSPVVEAPRVVGGYEIQSLLGRGSFGVVYQVRRPGIERPFALKVLLNASSDPEMLARFRLEAAIASKLEHPGIVSVVATGQHEELPYLVMEFCAGKTLRERLREGPLPAADAARLVAEIARAVAYAHERGVLHRDLKPANIMLEASTGKPRVTDFGLARDRSLAASMTRTGDVIGTPAYASPEQLRGEKDVDARADVYALGVILYECLTGTRPFVGADVVSLAEAVLRGPLRPPTELDPRIPEPIERACLRALARDRRARTPRASDLAEELEAALVARRTSRRERARSPRPPRRRAAFAGLAACAALAALAGGVALWRAAPTADDEPVAVAPPPPTATAPPDVVVVDDDEQRPPTPLVTTPPVAPPRDPAPVDAAARRAPDAEVEELLAATRGVRWHRWGNDEAAANLIMQRGPDLARRYPTDGRAVLLGGLAELLRSASTKDSNDLEVRRTLVRSLSLDPPPPEFVRDRIARLCHVLGFERAASDVLEPMFVDGALPESWQVMCMMQVLAKSSVPVQDVPRAILLANAGVVKREQEAARLDPELHRWLLPRTYHMQEALADLLVTQGDLAGGIRLRRELVEYHRLRGRRGEDEAAENQQIADILEQRGPNPEYYRVPARSLRFSFPATRYLHMLGELAAHADNLQEREAAQQLVDLTRDPRTILDPARKALMLVAAARLWTRIEDVLPAREALETAATLELGEADRDVRALVLRSLAALLLDDPARAEVVAKQSLEAANDPVCTAGERADAWLVIGLARQLRNELAGVAEARAKMMETKAFDLRWAERLR